VKELEQVAERDRVYVDETGCDERVQREYGWSRCGEVCLGTRVGRARERLSVVAAWHKDAAKPGLMAPLSFDGTCHSRLFEVWLRLMLCPLLRAGQVVILDNARFHRKKAVERILRRVGCTAVFLPPYSPDLNPIEQVFAKLKLLLRKAAERSLDATWKRIGSLLDAFPPHECANYLRNSGYAST